MFEFYEYKKLKAYDEFWSVTGEVRREYQDLYIIPADIVAFIPGSGDRYYKDYEIILKTGGKYKVEGNMFADTAEWSRGPGYVYETNEG